MITHRWINTQDLTTGITNYSELFRKLAKINNVEILRDPFNAGSGIYIVGREEQVNRTQEYILETINYIEDRVKRKRIFNPLIHKSRAKSLYRSELLNSYIKGLSNNNQIGSSFIEQKNTDAYITEFRLNHLKAFVWKG